MTRFNDPYDNININDDKHTKRIEDKLRILGRRPNNLNSETDYN